MYSWIEVDAKQTQTMLQLTIKNASSEIPRDERSRIFDRFYRVDSALTPTVEGIGLGLSLAREILRAHNGELMLNPGKEGEHLLVLGYQWCCKF